METVPLHEDPRQILKDAFSIFDTYDVGKYGCMHRISLYLNYNMTIMLTLWLWLHSLLSRIVVGI